MPTQIVVCLTALGFILLTVLLHLGPRTLYEVSKRLITEPNLSSDIKLVYYKMRVSGYHLAADYKLRVHKIDEVKRHLLNVWLGMDYRITTIQLTRGVVILEHAAFDHVKHPKFLNGEWSQAKVLKTFIDDFRYLGAYCKAVHGDKKCERISKREFVDYYMGYSTIIDKDVNFDYMMRHSWKI